MTREIFGYLSGAAIVLSFVPYVVSTLRGGARPEKASWFIWAVLGGITFTSQLASGATDSLWLPGLQTFGDSIVFLFSLRYGIGGFARRDRIALVLAGAGLLLWYLADEPFLALAIAVGIDAAGVFLTVRKNMEHPGTESDAAWILTALAGLLGVFAVSPETPGLLVYPVYIFLAGTVILISSHPFRRLAPKRER